MKKHLPVLLIAVAAFLSSPAPALAQGDGAIHGAVVARADGSTLPGATVVLQGATLPEPRETRTGVNGHFGFQRLVPGDYLLIVNHSSFLEERYRLTLRPREVQNLTLEMTLRPVEETMEVSAEAYSIPTIHSPGSTLLPSRRLEGLPLPQRTNLPEAILTSSPGMIRGHDDFVHIRGHEVALNPFINGVSFWENAHSVFSAGLGVDYIESMNVMTGGFSAEYGNRFGGVLDVVTKSGFTMDNNGSVTLGLGTALRHNLSMEYGGHTARAAYYLNLGGFESGRFLSPPVPRSIHNTGRGTRAFAQLDFAASDRNFLKLILMSDGTNFELPKDERDELLRPNFNNFQRNRSQSMILGWDHVPSNDTLLHTAFYQKWSRVRMLPNADEFGAKVDAERTLGTFGIKSDVTHFYSRHTVKGGVDLVLLRPEEDVYYLSQPWITFTHLPEVNEDHVHFRGPNLGAGIPRPVLFNEKKTGGQVSVYLQDKMQLTRRLAVDLGLRFDRYSLAISDSHFSPRLNVSYQFPSRTVLFGSYNHFFVPPPVENVLASSAGLTRLISEIGTPLPPVRAIKENQFELGVTQPVGNAMTVGLTGYYRISNDPTHTTLYPDTRFYSYASFDKGKAYGMEVKAEVPDITPLGLSGYFNYALGRVWFYNPINSGFTTEGDHISEQGKFLAPMDQTHTLTSGLTYRERRTRLWGSMAFEYGSGTPASHGGGAHEHEDGTTEEHGGGVSLCEERCPSHFTQNLSIGWDATPNGEQPHLTLQFNIENLTDNVYLISKESSMVQGQYSHPRLFSGSIKIQF